MLDFSDMRVRLLALFVGAVAFLAASLLLLFPGNWFPAAAVLVLGCTMAAALALALGNAGPMETR